MPIFVMHSYIARMVSKEDLVLPAVMCSEPHYQLLPVIALSSLTSEEVQILPMLESF